MKHASIFLLIVLLLIGCSPSAEQATATREAAQEREVIPTATSTPTSLPAEPPVPSPQPTRELEAIEVSGLSLDALYQSDEPGISFQYPSTWEVINALKMGGDANEIVVMEDYDKVMEDYINLTFSSMNFTIAVFDEASPAKEVVNLATCNTEAQQPVTTEEVLNGQDFFSVECIGFVNVDGQPLVKLMTGISNGSTYAVASAMIKSSSKADLQPIYEAIIRTAILAQE